MKKIISAILLVILLTLSATPAFAFDEYNYILDSNYRRVPIATAYTTEKVQIFFGDEIGPLSNPQDMFVDNNDNIYIVDTGKNRVIKFNPQWEAQLVVTQANGIELNNPNGIYVDEDEHMFIADTNNNRILHLNAA